MSNDIPTETKSETCMHGVTRFCRICFEDRSAEGKLLVLLRQIEEHCPCGARPESLNTHPHVCGCPVDQAIRLLDFAPFALTSAKQEVERLKEELVHKQEGDPHWLLTRNQTLRMLIESVQAEAKIQPCLHSQTPRFIGEKISALESQLTTARESFENILDCPDGAGNIAQQALSQLSKE